MESKNEQSKQINDNKKNPKKSFFKTFVMFIIFFLAWFAVAQYVSADKYETTVKVIGENEKIGVNPTIERLDFGDLPKGKKLSRFVTIKNNGNRNIYVNVISLGNISELIRVERKSFVLEPGKSERIEFLLEMPISASEDEYKGRVIIFKIPKII